MPYPLDKDIEEYSDEELAAMLSKIRGSRMVAKMTSPARKEQRKKTKATKSKAQKLMNNMDPEALAAVLKQFGGDE